MSIIKHLSLLYLCKLSKVSRRQYNLCLEASNNYMRKHVEDLQFGLQLVNSYDTCHGIIKREHIGEKSNTWMIWGLATRRQLEEKDIRGLVIFHHARVIGYLPVNRSKTCLCRITESRKTSFFKQYHSITIVIDKTDILRLTEDKKSLYDLPCRVKRCFAQANTKCAGQKCWTCCQDKTCRVASHRL